MTRSASPSRWALIAAFAFWVALVIVQALIGNDATFLALLAKAVLATAATVALAFAGVGMWAARVEKKRWTKRILPVIGERVADAHEALAKLVMTAVGIAAPLTRLDRVWYDKLALSMNLWMERADTQFDPWREIDRAVTVLTAALDDQEERMRAALTAAIMTGDAPRVADGESSTVSDADQRLIVARAAAAGPLMSTLLDRLRSALADLAQATPDDELAARLLEDAAAAHNTVGGMIEAATRPTPIEEREDLRKLSERRDLASRASAILGDPARGLRALLGGGGRSAQDILEDLSAMHRYTGGKRAVPAVAGYVTMTVAHYAERAVPDPEPTQPT